LFNKIVNNKNSFFFNSKKEKIKKAIECALKKIALIFIKEVFGKKYLEVPNVFTSIGIY